MKMANFKKTCGLIILLSQLLTATPSYGGKYHKPQSEDQLAAERQRDLVNTPLKIDSKCEPKGLGTKALLLTLNAEQTKNFWRGQEYAVQRTYRESLESAKLRRLSNEADARISAIENQRDEAIMRSAGVTPYSSPEFDKLIKESEAQIRSTDNWMAEQDYKWYLKCSRYASERSR